MINFSAVTKAYAGAWARRRVFVPIYIAVRLMLVALIAPGVAMAVNLAVSLSDQTALTDQDIAMFLLSPAGFIATIVILSLFLLAEVFVFAVMAGSLRMGESDPWRAGSSAIGLILSRLPDPVAPACAVRICRASDPAGSGAGAAICGRRGPDRVVDADRI